jgi:hypothetical protein
MAVKVRKELFIRAFFRLCWSCLHACSEEILKAAATCDSRPGAGRVGFRELFYPILLFFQFENTGSWACIIGETPPCHFIAHRTPPEERILAAIIMFPTPVELSPIKARKASLRSHLSQPITNKKIRL